MPTFTVHALSDAAADEARRSPGAVPAAAGDGPYPVRCCLSDAHDADGVVLASVMPFRGESPYAARSPVYVHAERCAGHSEEPGAVPEMLRRRLRDRAPARRRGGRVPARPLRRPRLLRLPDRSRCL